MTLTIRHTDIIHPRGRFVAISSSVISELRDLSVEDNVLKTSFCAPFVAGGVAKTLVCDRGEALVQ